MKKYVECDGTLAIKTDAIYLEWLYVYLDVPAMSEPWRGQPRYSKPYGRTILLKPTCR